MREILPLDRSIDLLTDLSSAVMWRRHPAGPAGDGRPPQPLPADEAGATLLPLCLFTAACRRLFIAAILNASTGDISNYTADNPWLGV
jgi:hypothetical protein